MERAMQRASRLILMAVLVCAGSGRAEFSYESLDDPAASLANGGTMAEGVYGTNVVGNYFDTQGISHAFLFNGTTYSNFDVPGSIATNSGTKVYYGTDALGISANAIVGWYTSANTSIHGFILKNGIFTTLDEPNSHMDTVATGISGSNVVGYYLDNGGAIDGFLYNGSSYTNLDDPNTVNTFSPATYANGIDGANIVGYYSSPANHGFLYDGTSFTTIDFPNIPGATVASGISGTNIVGYYTDSAGKTHGFTFDGNTYNSFDYPGAAQTYATGVWGTTVVGYYVDSTNGTHGFLAVPGNGAVLPTYGSLTVNLSPSAAVAAGAQWQVAGGPLQNSGATVTNLTGGVYTVSFSTVAGWITPSNQMVTVTNGETVTLSALYIPSVTPPNGLILLTNGLGSITHGSWPATLVAGQSYMVQAIPQAGSLFENWLGGTTAPYSVLSTSADFTFTMQPGLVLEANFVIDPFLTADGVYHGLFAPSVGDREQTNSGSFSFTLTTRGTFAGSFRIGTGAVPFAGKFGADGSAQVTSPRRGGPSLLSTWQLGSDGQSVTGTVTDGGFTAASMGYRNVFSRHPSTNYAGRYTLTIGGVTNPAVGPFGTSYGTLAITPTGNISFAGSLADGTAVSQSSVISLNGYWPMYIPLDGGKGSLWSWNYFSNGVITNLPGASWINPTNAVKTADYRSGFTNQNIVVSGGKYIPAQQPLLVLVNAQATLQGGDLTVGLTNAMTMLSYSPLATFGGASNSLSVAILPRTGQITGSFRNPSNPANLIKVGGVLQAGSLTGAGYFPGATQSGAFTLAAH
jgi:hypothetical protein